MTWEWRGVTRPDGPPIRPARWRERQAPIARHKLRTIEVSSEIHDAVKGEARKRGISMVEMLDHILRLNP